MNRIDLYNELILRENIRKAIRIVQGRRQKTLTEETKLRTIIRNLLNEEDSATEGPTMNTGGNALDQMLLNTNTLSELESAFKTLTTSPEQRLSFRAHIINAVVKALGIERVSGLPNAADGAGEAVGGEDPLAALEEAVRALYEAELSIGDTPEEDVEAAAGAPKLGQEPEQDSDPLETEREEFATGVGVDDTEDKTGRNYALDAWNKVEKNVTEAYANLGNEADRKQYYDYLITNLKLYFDQWESELEGTPEEPTTPEYDQEKQAETDIGGEEEMGMEEPLGGEEELDFGGL
mgnify:CR=1 FL=1|tara:strand:- start:872 stop:1750 length:879 start_codon:yes stop_codon:yes gene_type:complete